MDEIENILKNAEKKMSQTTSVVSKDFGALRTDRASTSLLSTLKVNYHDQMMPIEHLAKISVVDVRQLLLQPWDTDAVSSIAKSIQSSGLGVMPQIDGEAIRITIPPMSTERRQDIVKLAKKRAEEGKVSIRNIRREYQDSLRKLEKSSDVSKDDVFRAQSLLQKVTDRFVAEIDSILSKKESELTSI